MMRKNSKNMLVSFLVSGWLIGMIMMGNVSLTQIPNEERLTEIKSSDIKIENEYDFSKGTMENVSIDENGRLSLEIDQAAASLWADLTPSEKPSGRYGHSMAYDSDSKKVILFGGYISSGSDDETWMYDLGTNLWENMDPTLKPSPRWYHSMVYDSDSKKVILFGGHDSAGYDDETWTYDLGTNLWENMNPTLKPSERDRHSMAYDSDSRKVILFGGFDTDKDDETWTYDFGTNLWTNMDPTLKPSARISHSMVYDSDSEKVILFGGTVAGADDETWRYDLGTNLWTNMNPTLKPSPRRYHSMVYDSDSQKVILFGGSDSANIDDDETWTYNLGTNLWTNMTPTLKPSARHLHSMVYDSDSQKVILFGGLSSGFNDETRVYSLKRYFNTGRFNSQLMDVEYTCPITGEISWNPSVQPAETSLELQVGFSNTTNEGDFSYTPFIDSSFTFEGIARYIKYRAFFEFDPLFPIYTPYMETVYTNYTLGMPDYMEVFLSYLDGNASLLEEVSNQLGNNATLVETTVALATQNIEYLNSLNATLSGDITLLREIVDQLGIVVGDADYDGLSDLDELEYGTNLLCSDTDCDNLNDAFEIKYGTDPLNDDSDGDTWLDGVEAAAGTDPKNAADYPGASPPDESFYWPIYAGIGGVALVGVTALLVIKNKKKQTI